MLLRRPGIGRLAGLRALGDGDAHPRDSAKVPVRRRLCRDGQREVSPGARATGHLRARGHRLDFLAGLLA